MKLTRYFLISLLIAGICTIARAATDNNAEANRRKADYIFMEAASAMADQRADDYLMLLRRAAALAPDDPFIMGSMAEAVVSNGALRDQALMNEMGRLVIDRFYAEPSISTNGQMAVQVARYLNDRDLEIDILETMHRNLPKNQEVTLSLSDAYFNRFFESRNDTVSYQKGMTLLKRMVDAAPDNLLYTSRMVRPLLWLGDTAAVEERLEILNQAAPKDINTLLYSSQIYSALGRDSLVETFFQRGREIDPQNGQLLMAMADYYREKGDSVAYDREVFAALSAPDLDFDVKLPLLQDYVVNLYSDQAQRPRIDALFELMQQTNPGKEELHNLYGSYLVATDRNADAIDQYNVSLSLSPTNQPLYTELTRLNLIEKRYEDAAETGRKGYEQNPEDLWLLILTSYALSELDSAAVAIDLLENFNTEVLNEKGKGELYTRLGDLYYQSKRNVQAFDAYEKAILYDAENYMAMNNLAYFYAESDTLLSRAEMYATLAVGNQPDSPTFLDTFAWVLFKQNRFQEAAEQIDKALANCLIPDDVRKIIGAYVPETKEEAQEDADGTREVSTDIFDHAGDIYFYLRQPKKARAFWQAALKLADPEDAPAIEDKISGKTYFGD